VNEVSFRIGPHRNVYSTLGVDTRATGPRWRVDEQAIVYLILSMFFKNVGAKNFFGAKNVLHHASGTLICTSSGLAKPKLQAGLVWKETYGWVLANGIPTKLLLSKILIIRLWKYRGGIRSSRGFLGQTLADL
jgi:hypothetical protein